MKNSQVGKTLKIKQGPRAKLETQISIATENIRDGKILIAPLEHGYIFVCDAFNHSAVENIHRLRGDSVGTACQVLVGDAKTAAGVTVNFYEKGAAFAEKFWPGLLTINISVQSGLTWNLGDKRLLKKVSLRAPKSRFLLELTKNYGPLAIASASMAGSEPSRKLKDISDKFAKISSEVSNIFDVGALPPGPVSTVIEIESGRTTLIRAGAISVSELQSVDEKIVIPS